MTTWWQSLDRLQRFILLKLLTGELRVGVSQTLVVRALAQAARAAARDARRPPHGRVDASARVVRRAPLAERTDDDRSRPYPFFLASPLEDPIDTLGSVDDWLVEWKWDGIRAQLVRRGGVLHLWSRGEELITHRFPEIVAAASRLPDGTVLDGEVLAFRDERPLPFSALQQRIGRQKQVAQLVRDVPVVFMTYDILEDDGDDIRASAAGGAAVRGSEVHADRHWRRSAPRPIVRTASWADARPRSAAESRARGVEGLMLKRLTSPMASAASAATGGSGRSTPTRSTPC